MRSENKLSWVLLEVHSIQHMEQVSIYKTCPHTQCCVIVEQIVATAVIWWTCVYGLIPSGIMGRRCHWVPYRLWLGLCTHLRLSMGSKWSLMSWVPGDVLALLLSWDFERPGDNVLWLWCGCKKAIWRWKPKDEAKWDVLNHNRRTRGPWILTLNWNWSCLVN